MVTFLNWKLRRMGLSQLVAASAQASRGWAGGGLGDGAAVLLASEGVVSRESSGVDLSELWEEEGGVSACWQ